MKEQSAMPETTMTLDHKEDKMKRDLLVTLADDHYIEQAKQLFSSVYWHAGWQGDYMLLAYNISQKDLTWFREKGILIRECEPILNASEVYIGHAPLTTLSKFYLFTEEFKKWKNVVFLDGDIIVRGSLEALTDVQGFAAVSILNIVWTNLRGQFNPQNKKNKILYEELKNKYDLSRPAFNSGVMAFCTDMISPDDFLNIKNILSHFKEIIRISEETVLNLYFYDRWHELSPVYNMCPNYEMYLSGCDAAALKGMVLHTYSGFPGGKAWHGPGPLRDEWRTNLEKADKIDVAHLPLPKKILNRKEEIERDVYLKNLHRRNLFRFHSYKVRYVAGHYLKNNYPRVFELQSKLRHTLKQ